MTALLYVVSLLLAVLMGFAVHRASLCMLRTVAEILSMRRAYMMLTMLKAVLWVMAFAVLILFFLPELAAPNRSYIVTFAAITGGFLFGVGAATNGGCAFSTLGIWQMATAGFNSFYQGIIAYQPLPYDWDSAGVCCMRFMTPGHIPTR